MTARIASFQAIQNQSSAAIISDKVSMILFNHKESVPFENQAITEPDELLDIMLRHKPQGGTNYDLAVARVGTLITNYFDPKKYVKICTNFFLKKLKL
jgi:hypothetical protein